MTTVVIFSYHGTTSKRGGPGNTPGVRTHGFEFNLAVVSPALITASDLCLGKPRCADVIWKSGRSNLVVRYTQPSEGMAPLICGKSPCLGGSTFRKKTLTTHYSLMCIKSGNDSV